MTCLDPSRGIFSSILLFLALCMMGGCAAKKPIGPHVFYPSAPEPPRIQYLASYSSSTDVDPPGALESFLGGGIGTPIERPYGIAFHGSKLYLVDRKLHGYYVIDPENESFNAVARPQQLKVPINIVLDGDGTRYVADAGGEKVVVFDQQDQPLRAIRLKNNFRPGGMVVDGSRLLVGNTEGRNICVFDKVSGELLETFGDDGKLMWPQSLALAPDQSLLVVDTGNFCTLRYSLNGELLGTIGELGDRPGSFARPKGVAVDQNGRFYVVDAAFENLQMFDDEGQLLLFFGGGGNAPGNLSLPASVTIDYSSVDYFQGLAAPGFNLEYIVAVTSQLGAKLNIYGFGRMAGVTYEEDEDGAALAAAAP